MRNLTLRIVLLCRYRCFPVIVAAGLLAIPDVVGQSAEPLTLPMQRPGSLAILLSSDRVQSELKLDKSQKKKIAELRVRHRNSVQRIVKGADHGDVASKREAQRAIDAVNATVNSDASAILSVSQRKRLAEVERQVLGGFLLLSSDVRERLNLSPDQRAQLAKLHKQHQNEVAIINGWFEDGEVSNFERVLYLREEREQRADKMAAVLSRDQRSQFDALAGESFAAGL